LQVGVAYPQIELHGSAADLRTFADAVADAGLDHLLMYDHVLGAKHADRVPPLVGSYTERDPFHEPLTALSYVAARQERLGLATGVLVLPQRQTALVAKQAAELANLSGGRFRLGVGTGWNYVEYAALGQDFAGRGARLDEQVRLLRLLWSEPVVDFDGEFHTIERAGLNPLPAKPPPVWFGGYSAPAWRRGARLGDGYIFAGKVRGHADAAQQWAQVQDLVVAAGRDLASYGADVLVKSRDAAAAADEIRQWAALGGTHATIVTMGNGFQTVGQHIDLINAIAQQLNT
jgi:probable F420-dependent oxidoreductase